MSRAHVPTSAESHGVARDGDAAYATPGRQSLVEQIGKDLAGGVPAEARVVQRRVAAGATATTPEAMQAAASRGTSGAAGALPHFDRIQQLFGRHDVSGVRAYVGGSASEGAAAMGAEAFASGDQVAFGAAPDLHTAAHEAAHVVQQRTGVHLKSGIGETGDPYERHADAVADMVVQGRSAEALLDQHAGTAGIAAPGRAAPIQARWMKSSKPLPPDAAEWLNEGDGNAPTGVYLHVPGVAERWTRQGTDEQYVYDGKSGRLDRADNYVIDIASLTEAPQREHVPSSGRSVGQLSGASRGNDNSTSLSESAQTGQSGIRKQLPAASEYERPDLTLVQSLASTLFSEDALKERDVRDLIHRVLGDGFVQWARSGGIDDKRIEANVDQVCLDKLSELQKRYPEIALIDVIVIHAYSWYADKYVREERVARGKQGHNDFGKWQTFANQLTVSLRKLKRFTGDTLYRCSQRGHEAENLKSGGSWDASSFMSSTYTTKARDELESNDKYRHGSTLHMDAQNVEGYHMEEFSRFDGEHEVVLLPGHTVQGKAQQPSQGRQINTNVTAPPSAQPRTGRESDSLAEFDRLHQQQSLDIGPPPRQPGQSEIPKLRARAEALYDAATKQCPLGPTTFETLRPAANALAEFVDSQQRYLDSQRVKLFQDFVAKVRAAYADSDQQTERELAARRKQFEVEFLAEESGGLPVAVEALAGNGLGKEIGRRAMAYVVHLPTRKLQDELYNWYVARYKGTDRLPTDQRDTPELRLAHFKAERQPVREKFIAMRQRHVAERRQ